MAIEPILTGAARARDRGAAEDFPFPIVGPSYLGDPDVVEGILRTLAASVAAVRADYNAGHVEGPASTAAIAKLVEAAAPAFIGADAAYDEVPGWNAPAGGIVPFLRARGFADDTAAGTVEACLLNFAHRIINGMIAHEEDGDDEAGKFSVDSAVEDAVADLMGLPADAEDRDAASETPEAE
jgi:hypothetical protein